MTLSTDVCIVGSGAAGGVLAHALTRAGLKVVVLERGRPARRDETANDELLQVIRRFHQPPVDRDGPTVATSAAEAGRPSRIGQCFDLVGGGTILYAATSWRLRPRDLRKRSHYGPVAGAALADWPISYEDLEPWYTLAEQEIGVSGRSGADPTEPPRSLDHLMPPLKTDPFTARLEKAAAKLGWRSFPIPTAISSENRPQNGTYRCQYCGFCSGYTCLFYAKNSVDITMLPRAEKTGLFKLVTRAQVTSVELDGKGRAAAVVYRNLETGADERVQAAVVCLAAGGIQTPRLLLLSRGSAFPEGLANRSGMVGRHMMFHIEGRRTGVFDDEVFNFELAKKVGVHDGYFPAADAGFVNHCSMQAGSRRGPIRFAQSMAGTGEDWQRQLAYEFPRAHQVQAMVEDLPQESNAVGLDPARKDALGLALPRVVHAYHAMDLAALVRTQERLGQWLEAAGARVVDGATATSHTVSDAFTYHLMGTCRMGLDAKTSVVDASCRAHDVPNLFIADSSVFPTSAGLNPTLTIQANAYRVADHIVRNRKDF